MWNGSKSCGCKSNGNKATKTTKKSCNCKSNTNNNNTTTNNSYGNNGYICKPMYGFHPGYGCPQPYCPELDCYQKLCMAKQQLAAAENNFDEAVEVIENIYDLAGEFLANLEEEEESSCQQQQQSCYPQYLYCQSYNGYASNNNASNYNSCNNYCDDDYYWGR